MVARAETHKFTVEQYNRMAEAGVFRKEDRVELIEGEILEMAPIGSRHFRTVDRLTTLFAGLAAARRAILHVQNPVVLNERSKPQPDVVLLKYLDDFYLEHEPGPDDVWLLIEVADTSLDYDRLTKLPLYAQAGVPEVWLVDLTHDRVEVYRGPEGDSYRDVSRLGPGASLSPAAFPDIHTKVEDILG